MFTIKRKTARKACVTKKLPYFRVTDNGPCYSKAEQRMPSIDTIHLIKPSTVSEYTSATTDKLLVPDLPMLARPEKPNNILNIEEYIYEEKYDGERMLAIVFDNVEKKCFTRTLKISNIFKNNIILKNGFHHCIFDGELVYLDDAGKIVPICDTGSRKALQTQYAIFDVQMVNGEDVKHKSLLERKKLLEQCLVEYELVKISKYMKCTTIDATMDAFNAVCNNGGEGLMLKHLDGCYISDRRQWIKLKKLHIIEKRYEFDLYAYRFKMDKNGVRNILDCGYFDVNDKYVHVSNVSGGINNEKRNRLKLLSDPNTGLFYSRIIVTIIADKITNGKSLRHPTFLKIRSDIDSIDISKFS